MTKYLISFPSGEMQFAPEDFQQVADEAHAVVAQARAAGVYVFSGGIDEAVPPVRVAADGTVSAGTYPQTARIEGGYMVLELPSRQAAEEWAARVAKACRCAQELRAFMADPLA